MQNCNRVKYYMYFLVSLLVTILFALDYKVLIVHTGEGFENINRKLVIRQCAFSMDVLKSSYTVRGLLHAGTALEG